MKRLWIRGMLLGVSLALLLAGGVALAQEGSITADKECFTCAEREVPTELGVTGLEPENIVEFMLSDFGGGELCFEFWVDGEYRGEYCTGRDDYWYMWAYCGDYVGFYHDWGPYADDVGASHYTNDFEYGEWMVEACVENGALACAATTVTLAEVCEADFVPEPGTMALLGSGLVGLAGYATLRWRTRE